MQCRKPFAWSIQMMNNIPTVLLTMQHWHSDLSQTSCQDQQVLQQLHSIQNVTFKMLLKWVLLLFSLSVLEVNCECRWVLSVHSAWKRSLRQQKWGCHIPWPQISLSHRILKWLLHKSLHQVWLLIQNNPLYTPLVTDLGAWPMGCGLTPQKNR